MSAPETHAAIIAEMRSAHSPFSFVYERVVGLDPIPIFADSGDAPKVPRFERETVARLADRLEAAHKREMDEVATFINKYLEDSALDPKAHNWLIRNGYQDISYQADTFGQEIVKEGDST